jgi:hypothetical protein
MKPLKDWTLGELEAYCKEYIGTDRCRSDCGFRQTITWPICPIWAICDERPCNWGVLEGDHGRN